MSLMSEHVCVAICSVKAQTYVAIKVKLVNSNHGDTGIWNYSILRFAARQFIQHSSYAKRCDRQARLGLGSGLDASTTLPWYLFANLQVDLHTSVLMCREL